MTNETVMMYDNYIYYIISKFYGGYPNKEDLFQAGRIGLIDAYQKYDPSYGVQFKTYAFSFIKGEMSKFIMQDRPAKYSRSVTKLKYLIERETAILTQELMRPPTVSELALYLGEPEENIIEAMQTVYQMQSLQSPIMQDEKEITLEDNVATPQMDIDTLIALKESLNSLSPFELELIQRRYLYGETQSEIADHLGTNQVQVSRKVKKISEKIYQDVA